MLRALSWGGLSMLCLIAPTVQAQPGSYPSKAVRLIVPIAAGGAVDVSTRLVADRLSKKWGQPVVVENRPGGGGIIGAQTVASSPADGYTLLATPAGEFTIAPLINPKSEALYAGFQPIILTTDNPIVIVANSSFGASNLPEFIALARDSPEPLAYATAHTGSSVHFAGEWVASATGVKLRHIPFRGGAPAVVAVVGGELPLASLPVLVAAPFVKSGKIKSIAITSAKRISSAPDWPTVAEAGYSRCGYQCLGRSVRAKGRAEGDYRKNRTGHARNPRRAGIQSPHRRDGCGTGRNVRQGLRGQDCTRAEQHKEDHRQYQPQARIRRRRVVTVAPPLLRRAGNAHAAISSCA
jgi:tripartite-type tricarboxylate transporter receptor subunit TctC